MLKRGCYLTTMKKKLIRIRKFHLHNTINKDNLKTSKKFQNKRNPLLQNK